MVDLTDCRELTNKFGGSEKKKTILYNNHRYMVKFPDRVREMNNELSYMNNVFSEDIGCKIYKLLGFETQNTFLATYNMQNGENKIVVACEDFTDSNKTLIEFHKLSLKYLESDSIRTRANIDNIMMVIDSNDNISDKEKMKDFFGDMFIVDGFIGNSDRNLDNWGVLEDSNGNLTPAPIYDCGSSLSPLYTENKMNDILNNKNLFKREEYNVYSCYRINHKRILFSDIMKNPPEELEKAIKRICPKIEKNLVKIGSIIDNTPGMGNIHRKYIKESLGLRYKEIIKPAIKKYCLSNNIAR